MFIKIQAKERPRDVSRNSLREATEKDLQPSKHHKVGRNLQSREEAEWKQVRNFGRGREMRGEEDLGDTREKNDWEGKKYLNRGQSKSFIFLNWQGIFHLKLDMK